MSPVPRLPRKANQPVRLTDSEIRRLREAYADGVSRRDLAKRFGMGLEALAKLLAREAA